MKKYTTQTLSNDDIINLMVGHILNILSKGAIAPFAFPEYETEKIDFSSLVSSFESIYCHPRK